MLGAIIGDIIGSRFEFNNTSSTDFELFTDESTYTDDTICTIAIADAIMNDKRYKDALLEWCRKYPNPKGAYGGSFKRWIHSDNPQPYNSFGNGSAMRVSPVAWLFDNRASVIKQAEKSAIVSHDHPEGIKGAQAVAMAVLYGREKHDKYDIIGLFRRVFEYSLIPVFAIKENNSFNETCQVTVPQAASCFVESTDFESAIRLAVSIGGDSDTIAAITGSIAEAYYPIPEWMKDELMKRLPDDMKIIVEQFNKIVKS